MNTVDKVAVIGAGMMGAEIALSFALHGAGVLLKDISLDLSTAGKSRMEGILSKWEEKGKIEAEESKKAIERIVPQDDYFGFAEVDLVVEAAIEEIEILAITTVSGALLSTDGLIKVNSLLKFLNKKYGLFPTYTPMNRLGGKLAFPPKTSIKRFKLTHSSPKNI